MKIGKESLKKIIFECIYEVLENEPDILMPIIKENLRQLVKPKKKMMQTNEGRQVRQLKMNPQPAVASAGDIWDQLAVDTLKTTYQHQPPEIAQRDPRLLLDESYGQEPGPALHLRNAALVPMQNQHIPVYPQQQMSQIPHPSMHMQQLPQTGAIFESDDAAPSLAQLQAQFAAQQNVESDMPRVPDDLSMLGDMSQFVDQRPAPGSRPSLKLR